MARVTERRSRVRQPQISAALNRSNKIAASSTVVVLPGFGFKNLVTNTAFTNPPGGLTTAADKQVYTASMSVTCRLPVSVTAYPFAIYFIQTRNGSPNWVGLSSTTSNSNYVFVRGDLASTDSATFDSDSDINASPVPTSASHCYMLVCRSATDRALFVDGALVGTASASKTIAVDSFCLGGIERSNGWLPHGVNQLALAGLSQGYSISDGEAREFTANPWRMFAANRKVSRIGIAAAGGATVSVPAGAITLTGYAPTVSFTAHQTIAVPKGALVLSAFAPTVSTSAAQTITVPLASLTLTGFAPTVAATANQTISVPAASLTLTAYAPTVYTTAVTSIAVPNGTLTLTGYAPTINYTTNATIGVPAGALTLTGYAPTVIGGTSSVWTQVSAASGTWTPQ